MSNNIIITIKPFNLIITFRTHYPQLHNNSYNLLYLVFHPPYFIFDKKVHTVIQYNY